MTQIKFGTDGWRAIIAQEYTVDNVMRVAEATAQWLKNNDGKRAVVGHDCRFAGELFAQTAARVLAHNGIEVRIAEGFVSTPMVSLGVPKTDSDVGVVITASHNPPSYNGYKLKSKLGGPMVPAQIAEVEELISDDVPTDVPSYDSLVESGMIQTVDLEQMYLDHVYANFDMDLIRNSGIKVAYDAMYGAGKAAFEKLLPNSIRLHTDDNPGFHGQAPEPIERNLGELQQTIRDAGDIGVGIANDGDADRIGMFDGEGNFVDSHHILLLLLLYTRKYKGLDGKVVFTFSVTDKMKKLAEQFGLDYEITKIGFKYIAEIMAEETVIVGGEESGGLAVAGHIPERDGIWIGLMVLEFMAKTGKSLRELCQEVYDHVGTFSFDRDDLHVENDKKWAIIESAKNGEYTSFGDYPIEGTDSLDGYKFRLGNDRWVMLRPSGTEPVLRVYCQAGSTEEVRTILDAAQRTIL